MLFGLSAVQLPLVRLELCPAGWTHRTTLQPCCLSLVVVACRPLRPWVRVLHLNKLDGWKLIFDETKGDWEGEEEEEEDGAESGAQGSAGLRTNGVVPLPAREVEGWPPPRTCSPAVSKEVPPGIPLSFCPPPRFGGLQLRSPWQFECFPSTVTKIILFPPPCVTQGYWLHFAPHPAHPCSQ